jgi:hypothetical protein
MIQIKPVEVWSKTAAEYLKVYRSRLSAYKLYATLLDADGNELFSMRLDATSSISERDYINWVAQQLNLTII